LSFLWDTFDIERINGDKIVCSGFLSFSTNIDLPFRAPNYYLCMYINYYLCSEMAEAC
jgi:hypothetical protein